MRGYTTIEQSKKLLELGLSPESADMEWVNLQSDDGEDKYEIFVNSTVNHLGMSEDIPAWSLSVLLELMPIHIVHSTEDCYYDHFTMDEDDFLLYIDKNKEGYKITYSTSAIDMDGSDVCEDCYKVDNKKDFIDAAFEMVCWLLENGHIKTE